MKYTRGQFTKEYYQLWQVGLLLPTPQNASVYSVKYRKNQWDEYSRVTLRAVSASDALERACYSITYASPWRPEDIDLHAVYDAEENLLWLDEPFYDLVQKKNEFRGMERREFLTKFGVTSAAVLFGLRPLTAKAATTITTLSGAASGFGGEQLYTIAGSFSWTAPAGVTRVCVVCIGGGGGGRNSSGRYGGGGGGALSYVNDIAVTSGSNYAVTVGVGCGYRGIYNGSSYSGMYARNGGNSSFGTLVVAGGGQAGDSSGNGGVGGVVITGTGGNGGAGGKSLNATIDTSGGGGGAGGYSGPGGAGAQNTTDGNYPFNSGSHGSGGGGGGGAGSVYAGGGGVGLYGSAASGYGGSTAENSNRNGTGGSGGQIAPDSGDGGSYGGGGTAYSSGGASTSSAGAVRIVWGAGRSFPSNAT